MNHPNPHPHPTPNNSRRHFLRLLALLSGALFTPPFLKACQRLVLLPESETTGGLPHTSTPTRADAVDSENPTTQPETVKGEVTEPASPTEKPEVTVAPEGDLPLGAATIALVRTDDRVAGALKAMDLLGDLDFRGRQVLVKPNFNSGDPPPASTDIGLLEAVLLRLMDMGAGPITVGDRSGMGSATRIMEAKGGFALAEKLGFDFLDFNELGREDWVMVDPPGNHWSIQDSPLGRGFPFARPVYEAEALVSLCSLKTHRYGGITLSLKNSVGMVAANPPGATSSYMTHLHTGDMDAMIAEINLAYQPDLVIMDGVEAFISGGPARGELVSPGVVLAGRDRVALDALGVTILKMQGANLPVISDSYHLRNAIQIGIGVDSPEQVRILTGDTESAAFAKDVYGYLVENWG